MSNLSEKIREANAKGRKAVIPYLPAGFPGLTEFWDVIKELDAAGADVIEIGVPFSDPVADGPTVEQACLESLELGVTLKWILEELPKHRAGIKAGIVLMGYLNPFLQYGLEKLAKDAAAAGVGGLIIPDVPYEEAQEMKEILGAQGIDFIYLVGLNTPPERLKMYASNASGYVYLVSVMGITGARTSLPKEIGDKIIEVKEAFDVPLALGFGIKTPDQLEAFGDKLDGAVIGSALIDHIRGGGSAKEFLSPWV
ncbi:tryptophan synthase subunit alpha [Desulfovibrio ferrophilus]|uniref:Tryptophan synthase alpha chain n=1 Tax=Desulfovibrio ferrophilus TaxID=241368 RepID=A0A2Z6B2Q6_9BACT|nr:tryptophan synthase subunit alpha [Desulfovibrio ferrophilus]BBD09743.1 tryptophan synthase subunit alpha [Desulfovibrio ferrophilus]